MEILTLIDKLEQMAAQSKVIPLTGKAVVRRHHLLDLVDQMRLAVPRSVQDAQEVLKRREQILNQTVVDAKRIKAAADNESYTRLEESELVKSAKRRYDEIIHEAEAQGRQLLERVQQEVKSRRSGADQYARDVLSNLEQDLAGTLNEVRRGIDAMTPREEAETLFSQELAAKS